MLIVDILKNILNDRSFINKRSKNTHSSQIN